jgi:hypothetical protein
MAGLQEKVVGQGVLLPQPRDKASRVNGMAA